MAITKLTKHDNCEVTVEQTPKGVYHPARLKCVDHNIHIQWLGKQQADEICVLLNQAPIEWNDLNKLNDRERGQSLAPIRSMYNKSVWLTPGLFEVAK
tara:strand:+ start:20 stop:313 length:294 start_codon:yes stop_codon:yes gene_type:complete